MFTCAKILIENVLKVMSEVYDSIPVLCTLTQHIHTKTICVVGENLFE
jgi:hypothetical protein